MKPFMAAGAIDVDVSVVGIAEALRRWNEFSPNLPADSVFVGPCDYGHAKEVLDLLYATQGVALDRCLVAHWPNNQWSVGRRTAHYGFGSVGA